MAKLTKSKAREILHDKTAHGHPLTDKQRRFFAAKAFADIGVSLPNYNNSNVSFPSGFVGMGNSTKGFHHNGAWGGTMQMGGNLPGVMGNMYARIGAPSNGKYAKKTLPSAQDGRMMYYQHGLDFKTKGMQMGGNLPFDTNALKSRNAKRDSVRESLYNKYPNDYNKVNKGMLDYFQKENPQRYQTPINDDKGQWNHPGKVTKIGSNQITMQGVPYPVLGVSDRGHAQLMHPGGEYQYQGNSVTEYPIMAEGGQLKHLNQLIDFTNNNHMEQAKSGIHIKPSHKGLLHKHLGIPEGKKIPWCKGAHGLLIYSSDGYMSASINCPTGTSADAPSAGP